MSEGFVLMWRGIIGNPQFRGKDDEYAAMWLVLRAAWKETTVRINRQAVTLTRGECAYSISYLAEAWECSKASAHATLKHLEKSGFIRTTAERWHTRIYVINYDTYQTNGNDARTIDKTIPRTTPERSPNDPRTNKKEVKESKEVNEEEGAVESWNALAEEIGVPKVQKLTSARRSKLKARLSDVGGIEGWEAALSKIRASSFLNNPPKNGKHPNWRPDFDFILSESKFTKLMEGGYDDRTCGNSNPDDAGSAESDAAILRAARRVASGNDFSPGWGPEG